MKNYFNKILENFPEYIPGEQPQDKKYIKLNTNENPYPPSPKVFGTLQDAINRNLRLYPDPLSVKLRETIGRQYGFSKEEIFIGNGSDEILRLAIQAFSNCGDKVVFANPSYTLYETLTTLMYCIPLTINLNADFLLPREFITTHTDCLKIITNPNSPTSTFNSIEFIEEVIKKNNKIVIIDEAYADFAKDNALRLVKKYDNLIVSRTFSKSFSLASIRIGYCFANRDLINALIKIKDSYNINYLSQIAAAAAMDDYEYMLSTAAQIIKTREYLKKEILKLNFKVFDSESNFLFVKPLKSTAETYYLKLKELGILVRFFNTEFLKDYLRITIGTKEEIDMLIEKIKLIQNSEQINTGEEKVKM